MAGKALFEVSKNCHSHMKDIETFILIFIIIASILIAWQLVDVHFHCYDIWVIVDDPCNHCIVWSHWALAIKVKW